MPALTPEQEVKFVIFANEHGLSGAAYMLARKGFEAGCQVAQLEAAQEALADQRQTQAETALQALVDQAQELDMGYGKAVAAQGAQAEPAQANNSEVPYLIVFDDQDRENELVIGDLRAAIRFKQISGSWSAHLFVKLASNSRDEKFPCYAPECPKQTPYGPAYCVACTESDLQQPVQAAPDDSEILLAAMRRAVLPLAHAANAIKFYRPGYFDLDAEIAAAVERRSGAPGEPGQ